MRKILFISAVLVTVMTALQSCNKTTPDKYSKEQVAGDWHFLSGELPDVTSITPETIYHCDLSLQESGTGTLKVWYEADSESITDKTADISWTLASDRLTITSGNREQSFDVSLGDNGNLTLTSQDQTQAEYRKDQFSNLREALLEYSWYSPIGSKFREKISYNFTFKPDNYVKCLSFDKSRNAYTLENSYYELDNLTVLIYFSSSKSHLKYEWTARFLNEDFIGLGNMILQN